MYLAKLAFLLITSLALASEWNMPAEDAFLMPAKFNGQVKSVLKTTYRLWPKNNSLFFSDSTLTTFDKNGKALEKKGFDKTGSLLYTDTFKYDNKNNVLEWRDHSFSNSMITIIFKYDTNGKKLMQYTCGDKGKCENSIYKYDGSGNCIEKCYASNNGDSCSAKEFYKYENGLNTHMKRISYKKDSIDNITRTFIYNAKGQLISDTTYNSRGEVQAVYSYHYDDQGNLIRRHGGVSLGEGWVSLGNGLRQSSRINYSYTYDAHNNWIKMKEESKGIVISETERIIEYY